MKALVLAAGNGKRLSTLTQGHNKCMLQVNGKPLIQYNLENAVLAGVTEIVLVIGYQGEEIYSRFGDSFHGVPVSYVNQLAPHGLVDAMNWGRQALRGEDFLLFLGDELLKNPRHREMIAAFHSGNFLGMCGVVDEPDQREIRKTYAILQNEQGRIFRLIEKPENPPNLTRGTGNCVFRYAIFDFLDKTPINPVRGEKELPDLIQCAIDWGYLVHSFRIADGYININFPEDIQRAEASYHAPVSLAGGTL